MVLRDYSWLHVQEPLLVLRGPYLVQGTELRLVAYMASALIPILFLQLLWVPV